MNLTEEPGFDAFALCVGQDFDPDMPGPWQERVNTAAVLRHFHRGEGWGMVSNGRIYAWRCAFTLRRGRQHGVEPDDLVVRRLVAKYGEELLIDR